MLTVPDAGSEEKVGREPGVQRRRRSAATPGSTVAGPLASVADGSATEPGQECTDPADQAFLGWRLRRSEPTLRRLASERHLAGADIVDQRFDAGWTGVREASADARVVVVYVIEGCEAGFGENGEHRFQAGDVVTWHSAQKIAFRVLEPLHKLMLTVPAARLPDTGRTQGGFAGLHIGRDSEFGPMLAGYFDGLARQVHGLSSAAGAIAVEGALELVGKVDALQRSRAAASATDETLGLIRAYIEQHLGDADLGPAVIADALGISKRYVHLLFARQGATAAGWIRERRLEQCRQALALRTRGQTITDIALGWGFNDPAHFSRLFRRCYGVSPGTYRGLAGRADVPPTGRATPWPDR